MFIINNNEMEKYFVPLEEALELKKLGFNYPCIAYFSADKNIFNFVQGYGGTYQVTNYVHLSNVVKNVPAPLYSQAFEFFREKYDLDFAVGKIHNGTNNYHYHINLEWTFFEGTYEEAELECLKKLIEIINERI